MSGTHPKSRTQDISTCRHFWSGVNHRSTQDNLLLLPQSSMLLHKDEGSPVVLLCLQEISQDVTVKRYMELLNQRTMSNPSVFLYVMYHVYSKSQNKKRTRQCITPETKMMFLHPTSPSTANIQVNSFHQQLHNSCEIQHDHNERNALFSDRGSHIFLHLWELL